MGRFLPALTCWVLLWSQVSPGALAGDAATVENLARQGLGRLQDAERAWQEGRTADARVHGLAAETLFKDVLDQRSDHRVALMLAGQAASFAGEAQRAAQWADRLARSTPYGDRDPDLLYLRAFIDFIARGDPTGALQHLERMLAVNPRVRPVERDTLAYLALTEAGRRRLKKQEYDAAVQQFQASARVARRLGHTRKETAAMGNFGIALRLADRFEEAADVFSRLKEGDPENPVWWWQMGLNFADQNRFDEAMPEYIRVLDLRAAGKTNVELDDELKLAWLRLGNCLRHVGERPDNQARRTAFLQRAKESIENYMREAPESSLGPKWMGVLLLENFQNPHAAEPYFRRAYAIDPVCDDALRYMIQIHEQYPPPPQDPAPADEEARTQFEAAWRAPVAEWKRELEANQERHRATRDARDKNTGTDGCM